MARRAGGRNKIQSFTARTPPRFSQFHPNFDSMSHIIPQKNSPRSGDVINTYTSPWRFHSAPSNYEKQRAILLFEVLRECTGEGLQFAAREKKI